MESSVDVAACPAWNYHDVQAQFSLAVVGDAKEED
jgi:hypothetical protein